MQTITVKSFNNLEMAQYKQDCIAHQGGIFPQIMLKGFRTRAGELRMHGYVAYNKTRQTWARTKKQAIKLFNKGN